MIDDVKIQTVAVNCNAREIWLHNSFCEKRSLVRVNLVARKLGIKFLRTVVVFDKTKTI